jgi:hypothetical protein
MSFADWASALLVTLFIMRKQAKPKAVGHLVAHLRIVVSVRHFHAFP